MFEDTGEKHNDDLTMNCSEIILKHFDRIYVSVKDFYKNEEVILWTRIDWLVGINYQQIEYERQITELIVTEHVMSNSLDRQIYSMILPW